MLKIPSYYILLTGLSLNVHTIDSNKLACVCVYIRGYHVYKAVWANPVIRESLTYTREKGNRHDIYAVAVQEDDSTTVEHVPREISCICNLFRTISQPLKVLMDLIDIEACTKGDFMHL